MVGAQQQPDQRVFGPARDKAQQSESQEILEQLEALRTWDGRQVAPDLKSTIIREYERLQMVEDQIKALEKEKRKDSRILIPIACRK